MVPQELSVQFQFHVQDPPQVSDRRLQVDRGVLNHGDEIPTIENLLCSSSTLNNQNFNSPCQEGAHAHVEARLRGDHLRLGEVDASISRMRHRKSDTDSGSRSVRDRNDREGGPGWHHNLRKETTEKLFKCFIMAFITAEWSSLPYAPQLLGQSEQGFSYSKNIRGRW